LMPLYSMALTSSFKRREGFHSYDLLPSAHCHAPESNVSRSQFLVLQMQVGSIELTCLF
jgi:hypothetical protein